MVLELADGEEGLLPSALLTENDYSSEVIFFSDFGEVGGVDLQAIVVDAEVEDPVIRICAGFTPLPMYSSAAKCLWAAATTKGE